MQTRLHIKSTLVFVLTFSRKNPHLLLAILLFISGSILLTTKVSTISGALFGAGASLLGAWITELNNRRTNAEGKALRETEARRYLAAELNRTITRVLYIHSRAIANFSCASANTLASLAGTCAKQETKPNDLREDFIPYMPSLYPSAPQFRDLSGDDATALIAFYDSLHTLDKFVIDWWDREGQLPVNIFNMILTHAEESLALAEICIQKFELEKYHPPKYESWGSLSSRIERSKESARQTLAHHIAKFETKNQRAN